MLLLALAVAVASVGLTVGEVAAALWRIQIIFPLLREVLTQWSLGRKGLAH